MSMHKAVARCQETERRETISPSLLLVRYSYKVFAVLHI